MPEGITLRQWYAGLAMQAIIAKTPVRDGRDYDNELRDNALACGAFEYVDAMIAAEAACKN